MIHSRRIVQTLLLITLCAAAHCSDDGQHQVDDAGRGDLGDAGKPIGDSTVGGAKVISDDNKAVLTIPAGALPAGTAPGAITVKAITQSEAIQGALPTDWFYLAGYKLSPDGLTFTKPALLTVTTPIEPGLLLATLVSNTSASNLSPTFVYDRATDQHPTGASVPVPHFSRVVLLSRAKAGTVKFTAPLTPTIPGGPTAAAVQVAPTMFGLHSSKINVRRGDGKLYAVSYEWVASAWGLDGWFINDHSIFDGNLVPKNPANPIKLGDYMVSAVELHQPFTCRQEAKMGTFYRAFVELPAKATYTEVHSGKQTTASVRVEGELRSEITAADCKTKGLDLKGDFIDSIKLNLASFKCDCIDIGGYGAHEEQASLLQVKTRYNFSTYACGETLGPQRTVCPQGVKPMPAGKVYTFVMTLADKVPLADAKHSFIYSLVLDSDDMAANNWKFVPPYDWDLFQGTDRWYQLIWDHKAKTWSVKVTQVDDQQQTSDVSSSTVRAVINGAAVAFHLAASELPSSNPGYRLTAFGHDGAFSQSDRGADVSGVDPTKPLVKVSAATP